MSTTDALTITSAPDALTRYYYAKEREESAVLYINDAYLEAVDALEKLEAENARLREQMERLVTLLRNDCDIDASWDGLRRFWSIGLTEDGCLMRDRACKAEAENARLRAMRDTWAENDARLRELVRHMHTCMEHYEHDGIVSCDRCPLDNDTGDCDYERRMRELGIGVSADA